MSRTLQITQLKKKHYYIRLFFRKQLKRGKLWIVVLKNRYRTKKSKSNAQYFFLLNNDDLQALMLSARCRSGILFMRFFTHALTRVIFHVCGGMRNVRVRPRDSMHFYKPEADEKSDDMPPRPARRVYAWVAVRLFLSRQCNCVRECFCFDGYLLLLASLIMRARFSLTFSLDIL